jgi:hypothetical protein
MYFKAFKLSCVPGKYKSACGPRDVEYEVGVRYTIEGDAPPVLGERGYHACSKAVNCYSHPLHYNFEVDALGIVELGGETDSNGITTAGSSMVIRQILSRTEMISLCTGVDTDTEFIPSYDVYTIANLPADIPQRWYCNGQLHRDGDKPAAIYSYGIVEWRRHGLLHRDDDRPALIHSNGCMEWFVLGMRHRDGDKPAIMDCYGGRAWYQNGARHRDDGKPAIMDSKDGRAWFKHGYRDYHLGEVPPTVLSTAFLLGGHYVHSNPLTYRADFRA